MEKKEKKKKNKKKKKLGQKSSLFRDHQQQKISWIWIHT